MTNLVDDLIHDFEAHCREKINDFENIEVKCGIIGQAGNGKSSLINAIAGEKIAKTGVVECTMEPLKYQHRGIVLVDLPGCGTQKWPQETYVGDLKLLSYDCFLLVTANQD